MSDKFNIVTSELKNKKGFVLETTKQYIPKQNQKINISEINRFYQALSKKYKRKNFIIRAMGVDGMKTLKKQEFMEDDLKWILNSYYQSYGVEAETVKEKFSDYFFFEVTLINI